MASLGLPWPGHALHASSGVAGSDLAWVEGLFPSQLGLKNPPKSTPVLTCLDLFCPVLSCSVLSWLLTPNLDTPNHENHCFSCGKTKFFEKSFFDNNIDFVSILEPTWPCFAPQNLPKSVQKSIPTCNKILIDFWIAFWTLLAPFWKPRRPQDGPKSPPRWPQETSKKQIPLLGFRFWPPRPLQRPRKDIPRPIFDPPKTDF